ncbi:MAG TPA: type II secretion system protein [Thermoanaerobaculia bacterium]|nr:type II secretion system protein [Thermoanaerobaculia bacterium]
MTTAESAHNGFSLLEVLIALTILGIALLLGMALVLQNPRIVRRANDERQAFRAMESTLEAVRAGAIPLQTSVLDGFVTAVGTPAPKDLTIEMQVDPTTTPGLYNVTLSARYSFARQRVVKRLRTMVWSPPSES